MLGKYVPLFSDVWCAFVTHTAVLREEQMRIAETAVRYVLAMT